MVCLMINGTLSCQKCNALLYATGENYVDSGALIVDNIDGDLSKLSTSYGVANITGLQPTPPDSPYVIVYQAQDSSQNIAVPSYRLVHVLCRKVSPNKAEKDRGSFLANLSYHQCA